MHATIDTAPQATRTATERSASLVRGHDLAAYKGSA